jgi:hypothetical protein
VAFLADSKTLASAGPDKFRLWDVITGNLTFEFPAKGGTWCSLAVDPHGRFLAFCNGDNEVQVWQVGAAKP